MRYPATFTPDEEDGGFVVTFRDIPEAITQGETLEEATLMAEDVLLSSIEYYLEKNKKVPLPSRQKRGEHLVRLSASIFAKVLLLNEMLDQKVKNSDLAAKIGVTPAEITRLTSVRHTTKIDRIERALQALGKRLELTTL